jgi:hypothetical protein
MTDPTGFVPDGSPFVFVVPAPGALLPPDPTGFVPPAGPFTFVVPDGPEEPDRDRAP